MRNWALGRCSICVVGQPSTTTGTATKAIAQARKTAAYRSASRGARPASHTSVTSAMGSGVGLVQTARLSSAAELAQRPRQTSTSAATASRVTITSICPHAAPVKRMSGLKSTKAQARRHVLAWAPASLKDAATRYARPTVAAMTGSFSARSYTWRFGSSAYVVRYSSPVTSGHGGGYPTVVSWPKPTWWKTVPRSSGE